MIAQPETNVETWHVLVCGLPLSSDFDLGAGIRLEKLRASLTVFDLASVGAVGFRAWAVLEPLAHVATAELLSPVAAAEMPGYDALNKCWLMSVLLFLRGFSKQVSPAVSGYSWNLIAGHQVASSGEFKKQLKEEGVEAAVHKPRKSLPPFQGQLLDYHIKMLTPKVERTEPFNAEDASWIKEHFAVFNNLASNDARFRFALEAVFDWRYNTDLRAAISRLWAGIESMFGISAELVYRISLSIAASLEPRGEGRIKMFSEVKTLYGIRSKAVHGEQLTEEQLVKGLDGSFGILRRLILDAVNRGAVRTSDDLMRDLLC